MARLSMLAILAVHTLMHVILLAMPSYAHFSNSLSQKNSSAEDVDLVSFLSSKTQQQDAIFAEAVQLLKSMESSASCNRIAASRLVTSCQSIGGKTDPMDSDIYLTLEHVRSLYAARLAICEINGAGASTPSPCLPVTVFSPQQKGMFGFVRPKYQLNEADAPSAEALEHCLKSLESRPQWWTSYSNSRQNAVVICQAARIENEREELLELYRSIVESSAKLNQGLQEALRAAVEQSTQYKAFLHAMKGMRLQVERDLEVTRSRFKESFESLILDVESGVHSVFVTVKTAFGSLQAEVVTVEKDIQAISSEARDLRQTLKSAHEETLARHEEMTNAQEQASLTHCKLASSLGNQLEGIVNIGMPELSQSVERFDTSLEWLYERFSLLLQQEQVIAERLREFETSLDKSKRKAHDLHETQVQQVKSLKEQSKLQQTLSDNLRITQAILDKTVATTANVQAVLDETTTRYKRIPLLGGLLSTVSPWTLWELFIFW
ncbi:nuclear membrane fusion protein Kar5 [Aspergillus terreus]|uniref:Nuclear membrane fusion protein Kar5 n=1 Tax=Aspergillus terreus TaxID=33178 RepID=A0A5M3Z6N5_ASPTE|nr:hypothetical protein ATETN484_0010041900 [Aspergillus terreus]GFF18466.1 nuclear membrane fusion protein Kar5 [Aspergillus terreus]